MVRILTGDCRDMLPTLKSESVHCCITSPPYWGLRDYQVAGQIGLEGSVLDWVGEMVRVFREVRRVLRKDATLWLNLGDAYASGKNLIGLPWRVAFALQADGWHLRQDIIWHKSNPMPEAVRDRCTKAHEYVFLLSKSSRYHYDFGAMQEPVSGTAHARGCGVTPKSAKPGKRIKANASYHAAMVNLVTRRNRRSVWKIPTEACAEAHFATFPRALVLPCLLAGCPESGTVLDPFAGIGTVGLVAEGYGRHSVMIELNTEYATIARRRTAQTGMFFCEEPK